MKPSPARSATQLRQLFPFLVAFDARLRVAEVGPAWARLCPAVAPGADATALFEMERPAGPFTWDRLEGRASTIFLLRCVPLALTLRGQVVPDDGGRLLFLGFPWVTEAGELTRLGITMTDFPPHVGTPDFLFLLRAKNAALDDARQLTREVERQRAVVKAREEQLRRIIDTSLDAVISMDADGVVTTWNSQAQRTFGWTENEAVGRLLSALIIPAPLREAHARGLAHFLATGEGPVIGRRIEVPAVDRDGVEFPVELTISALREGNRPSFHAFVRDIRDRKLAEEQLRESRERLDLAVESADIGIWDWNLETDEIVGNNRWQRILGYGDRKLDSTGDGWRGLLHPDDVERAVREVAAHLRGETPFYESEYRLRDSEGGWKWILSHGRVVARDGAGKALRVSGVQFDVSRRKRSEQALAAQNAVTQVLSASATLEEAAPRLLEAFSTHLEWEVGEIWAVDPSGTTLGCVAMRAPSHPDLEAPFGTLQQLQVPPGLGLPGQVWESRAPRWIRDLSADRGFLRARQAADLQLRSGVGLPIRTGDDISGVLALFCHDERPEDPERIELLLSLSSQIGQFLERRRSEQALRDSEARLRNLIDTAHDAVVSMDAEGSITGWSTRAVEMFGYAAEEVVGRRLDDVIVPESLRGAHERGIAHYFRTGESRMVGRSAEWTARHRDGREFPVEVAVTQLTTAGVVSFAGFVRDITERKRVEAELAAAKEAAESANEAKTRFLAQMSHEIRTPLNPILGMTSLLLDTNPSAEQKRYLERIRESGMMLLRLINEILDFSKIEAGKIELETVRFDARGLTEWVRDLFLAEAREKGLGLEIRIDKNVPSLVRGDSGRVQQVLANLVSNAIKFTHSGGVLVTLRAMHTASGRTLLEYRVDDTGIGIPDHKRDTIFDAFTQADASTTRRFGGSGLGLSIARELARRMGGDIEVRSNRAGSTFCFLVPVDVCAPGEEGLAAEAGPRRHVPRSRILVAEDNAANQEVIVAFLRRLGHAVDVVGDGDQAVAAFRNSTYDLVLMDCQMPGRDGFGATKAIRHVEGDERHTPIVAMTAYAVAGDRERCLDAGMDDYLSKPVDFDELGAMLEKHLGTWSQEEAASVQAALPRAAAEPAAVDERVLAKLRAIETPERPLVAPLIDMFLAHVPGAVEELTRFAVVGDEERVARIAHDLKTESGNLGAKALSAVCSSIQDAARAGRVAEVTSLLPVLREETARACEHLRRLGA